MTYTNVDFVICNSVSTDLEFVSEVSTIIKDRITSGPVFPKQLEHFELEGVSFSRKKLDLYCLLFIACFTDELKEYQEYILYEMNEYLNKFLLFADIAAAIQSKEIAIQILLHFRDNYPRYLFGTILEKRRINRVLSLVRLRGPTKSRPRRVQRCRGYRDHGSKRPDDRWLPDSDFELTELQLQIEEKRSEYQALVNSIVESGDLVQRNYHRI